MASRFRDRTATSGVQIRSATSDCDRQQASKFPEALLAFEQ